MEKFEIKKTIIYEREIYFSLAAIIYASLKIKNPDFWIVIPIAFLGYIGFSIISRLKKGQTEIIIDKYGIHIKSESKSFSWDSILDATVKDLNGSQITLTIKTAKSNFETEITNLNTTSFKIEKAIVSFSKGKIKARETKFFNSIDELLNDKKNLAAIIDIFKKHKRKMLWFGILVFFGGLALSIYFQATFAFPYSFAIGWSMIMIALLGYNKIAETKLRDSDLISGLTDTQFNEIAIKFEIRNNVDKKNKMFALIFMIVISIGIFIISYLLTN